MTYSKRPSIGADWPLQAILVAGLVGAIVDAAYFSGKAMMMGASPAGVLRSISAFWLGKDAFGGGLPSAALGAATHVGLAIVMAGGFFLARRRLGFLRDNVVVAGIAYGLFLYLLMYLLVLPARWPALYPKFDGWNSVQDLAAHLAVGISFAYLFKRAPASALS